VRIARGADGNVEVVNGSSRRHAQKPLLALVIA